MSKQSANKGSQADRPDHGEEPNPEPDLNLERFIHHTALPHTRMSLAIDRMIRRIGEAASWVWVALLAVIVLNVTMRYVFDQGRIEFEEIQWHLYSIGFLVGLSYVFTEDEHVRVDVFHERFSLRTQCWIELYGILLLLVPFMVVVLIYAVPFAIDSYQLSERSQAPGGLGHRYFIKAFLAIGFALLALSALARLARVCSLLFGAPRAVVPAPCSETARTSEDPAEE